MPNKAAVKYLEEWGFDDAKRIIDLLIDNEFVEDQPVSRAEDLADRAAKWLGTLGGDQTARKQFELASGWSTDSWRIVANNSYEVHLDYPFSNPTEIKLIFQALCIMAGKAGIDYMEL